MPFYALLLLLGVLVICQTTVLDYVTVYGIKPDLVMLLVIINGFLLGPRQGAFLGFIGGVIEDLFCGSYIGMNALANMSAGFLAGAAGERLYKENTLVVCGVTFLAALAGLLVNYLLLHYLDINLPFFQTLARIMLPTALYTALLAPLLFKSLYHLIMLKDRGP